MSHIKYCHAKVHLFNFEEIFFISLDVCLINFMCNVSCNLLQKRKQFLLWESTATSFSTNQANVFASHRYSWSKVSGTGFRIEIYPCFYYLCIYHSGHRPFSVAPQTRYNNSSLSSRSILYSSKHSALISNCYLLRTCDFWCINTCLAIACQNTNVV